MFSCATLKPRLAVNSTLYSAPLYELKVAHADTFMSFEIFSIQPPPNCFSDGFCHLDHIGLMESRAVFFSLHHSFSCRINPAGSCIARLTLYKLLAFAAIKAEHAMVLNLAWDEHSFRLCYLESKLVCSTEHGAHRQSTHGWYDYRVVVV